MKYKFRIIILFVFLSCSSNKNNKKNAINDVKVETTNATIIDKDRNSAKLTVVLNEDDFWREPLTDSLSQTMPSKYYIDDKNIKYQNPIFVENDLYGFINNRNLKKIELKKIDSKIEDFLIEKSKKHKYLLELDLETVKIFNNEKFYVIIGYKTNEDKNDKMKIYIGGPRGLYSDRVLFNKKP